jgi:plasmid maintenance system antidote protein VapI
MMNNNEDAVTTKRSSETVWRLHEDTPLGARLRALFDGANNSEIARRLGVHNSTIHTIVVSGSISARMLSKVAAFTGCDPDWLRDGDEYLQASETIN